MDIGNLECWNGLRTLTKRQGGKEANVRQPDGDCRYQTCPSLIISIHKALFLFLPASSRLVIYEDFTTCDFVFARMDTPTVNRERVHTDISSGI